MARVLIMGASRGLGLELARQYLTARDEVFATAHSDAGMQALQELGLTPLRLDVSDAASVQQLGERLKGESIDIAWHVAGVMCSRRDARHAPSLQEFDRVMHTNVLGAMQTIPVVAPLVEAAQGRFGFLTSVMGQIGSASASNAWLYRSSKAALNMVVASARHSYPKAWFALFHPGWVKTDMGGDKAPLGVRDSVTRLRVTLQSAGAADNGAFFNEEGVRLRSW
ncbi:SDR family oxidoreductase [Comamonas sp. NLF-1-9]|uniref:SDR family oxidoreductase n=1 Tax=Comamonas sp. NLF-1-9 TaxID=2853163 RepID=UPI001C43A894|nr:SDR family oxidoreductase [Comamonas sp. NLF-1-9]QXL84368.1 SDR family oxidoreductase [Comamonas sp. NLF-1-9]